MNLKNLKNSNTLVSIFVEDLSNSITLEETLYSISKQKYGIDLLVLYSEGIDTSKLESIKNSLDSPKLVLRENNEKGALEERILETDEKINYFLLPCDCNNFAKIFNKAFNVAMENEYEFFSIIEPNDIVGLNWYAQVDTYAKENQNTSIFFPLIRNTVNGTFNGLLNEAPWAEGLAEEAGKIDINLLIRFNCITPLGASFRVKSIQEFSEVKDDGKYYPIKESIKLSHYYEFLMRMIFNDVKTMVIPRIGYEFRIKSNNFFKQTLCKIPYNISQMEIEKGGFSVEETQFWINFAKQDYFFDTDRNKTYEETV